MYPLIKTAGDADRVLMWLGTVLGDMNTQVQDRGAKCDEEWLRKGPRGYAGDI